MDRKETTERFVNAFLESMDWTDLDCYYYDYRLSHPDCRNVEYYFHGNEKRHSVTDLAMFFDETYTQWLDSLSDDDYWKHIEENKNVFED